MNHSANEVPLDGRTQNSIYSKNNFQDQEENDGYMHEVPQQSFEGAHGINEGYEEDQDFEDDQQEEFEENEYEGEYLKGQDQEYYAEGEEMEEGQDEYPKVRGGVTGGVGHRRQEDDRTVREPETEADRHHPEAHRGQLDTGREQCGNDHEESGNDR